MNPQQPLALIDRIHNTADHELDCDDFGRLAPAYADAEVKGASAGLPVDDIRRHLDHCPDCADEYETLVEAASLEERDRFPSSEELLEELGRQTVRANV